MSATLLKRDFGTGVFMSIFRNSEEHLGIIHLYVCRIFRKTDISYPLIHTRTCAYQWVRNVSFSENFAYLLNE